LSVLLEERALFSLVWRRRYVRAREARVLCRVRALFCVTLMG
jgi:hypothetical protein